MQPDAALVMQYFFTNIDVFLLVIVRVLGFTIILPVLTGANIPSLVKVLFSVSTAFIIFSSNMVVNVEYYDNIMGFAIIIIEEFVVGFLIGFVVYMVFSCMYFVGQLMDMQIGLSALSVLDPVTQIQVPIIGNLLFMLMGLFLVQAGGLHAFISALFYSYDMLPLGSALLLNNGNIINEILQLTGIYFVTGVQVSMPLVGSVLVIDLALGLLVKSVPQMNVFVVGMPMKLLFGLIIMYFIVPVFTEVYDMLFSQSMHAIIAMIRGLTP